MRGRKKSFAVELTETQRSALQRWLRCPTLPAGQVRRARLILLLGEGQTLTSAARLAGLSANHARKWARRFVNDGLDGLSDQPGRGRRPVFSPRSRAAVG